MKIDWTVFQEKRCLFCLTPFYPKSCTAKRNAGFFNGKNFNQSAISEYTAEQLCPNCAETIQEKTTGYCLGCGEILQDPAMLLSRCGHCENSILPWDTFSFFAEYDGIFRELILKAKFRQNRAAMRFLGELTALFLCKKFPEQKELHIVPMPLHEKRLIDRGYNQCLEILKFSQKFLAKNSAKTLHIHRDIVRKKFFTVPQSTLDKKERQKNIKNSFTVSETDLKEIILFDDVATTRSTLTEVCKELRQNGTEKIHVLVLAKA